METLRKCVVAGVDGAAVVSVTPIVKCLVSGSEEYMSGLKTEWRKPEAMCAAGCTALASLYSPKGESRVLYARCLQLSKKRPI